MRVRWMSAPAVPFIRHQSCCEGQQTNLMHLPGVGKHTLWPIELAFVAFRDLPCLTHVWAGAGHSKYTFKECKILKEPLQIITNRKIDKREQVTSRSIELSFLLINRHLPSRFEDQAKLCCRREKGKQCRRAWVHLCRVAQIGHSAYIQWKGLKIYRKGLELCTLPQEA